MCKQPLLDLAAAPLWMQHQSSPHIHTSYRPPLPSFRQILRSLFYPHNELLNAWTHLLPALYFLHAALQPLQPYLSSSPSHLHTLTTTTRATTTTTTPSSPSNPTFNSNTSTPLTLTISDTLALSLWALSAATCHLLSAASHLGAAHSRRTAAALLRMDYAGITLVISATSASAMHAGLRHVAPDLTGWYLLLCTLCAGEVLSILGEKGGGWRRGGGGWRGGGGGRGKGQRRWAGGGGYGDGRKNDGCDDINENEN